MLRRTDGRMVKRVPRMRKVWGSKYGPAEFYAITLQTDGHRFHILRK